MALYWKTLWRYWSIS